MASRSTPPGSRPGSGVHDPPSVLRVARSEQPDFEFTRQGARTITFREARDQRYQFAQALRSAGLEPGDRFAFLAKNSIEFLIAYLAASASETVIVPLNFRLAPPEWSHLLDDSGARLLVTRGELLLAIEPIRQSHPAVSRWIVLDRPTLPGWLDYHEWLRVVPEEPLEVSGLRDGLCQMYPSGTGRPKGAILTHRGVTANATPVVLAVGEPLRPGERTLVVMLDLPRRRGLAGLLRHPARRELHPSRRLRATRRRRSALGARRRHHVPRARDDPGLPR